MSQRNAVGTGDLVEVTFLDHCEDPDGPDPLEFTVWGELTFDSPACIEITSWSYADRKHRTNRSDKNEKRFQILRKVITKIRKLR